MLDENNENIITSIDDGKNFRRKIENDNRKPILVYFNGKVSRLGNVIVDTLNFIKAEKGQVFYEEILKIRTLAGPLFSKSLDETFNHELIKGVYVEKEKYKSASTSYIIELYLAILEQFGYNKEDVIILFADEKNSNNIDTKCLGPIIWTEPYDLYDSEYDNSVLHASYEVSDKLPEAGSNIIIIYHKDGNIIDANLKDDHPQKREIRFSKDVKKNCGITQDSLKKGKKFEVRFGFLYPNIRNHLVILDIQEKIIESKKVTESVPKKMTELEKVTVPIIETETEDKLERKLTEDDLHHRYIDEQCVDRQGLALLLHQSIIKKMEKDNVLSTVDINAVIDSIPEIGFAQITQIINDSIDSVKTKNDKESKDRKDVEEKLKKKEEEIKLELEKTKKDSKDRAEKISMEEYVKMFHGRLRQGLFMYKEIDIEFFFSSILSGQWTNLRGVNGIGKDLLLILFATLSCEDFDEQVLFIPPSLGQEIDDTRTLGYQSGFTDKYYHSRYTDHISRSNKNPSKLYIIINSEANIVNMDRSYLPISVAIDSANKKITLPRYRKEGDTSIEEDPEIKDNILIFNTTNDIIRRPEITLKDIDRMSMINLIDPIIRSTEDRKKLENADGTNNYKPIIGPEPIFIELCKKYILTSRFRTTNLRGLYWIDNEYRNFEDEYQDDLRDEVNKLNAILKNGHLRNAQMAPRFTESALRFLYVAIKKLKIDPKLAKIQLMLERFVPRIEDITEYHIDTLDIIKDELIEYLSIDKDADPIKEIDEIIWKLDPHHKPKKR